MKRVKYLLFLFFLLSFPFVYLFFNSLPDARVCNFLISQSLENPLFYDYASRIGCSNRLIVSFLNSYFGSSNSKTTYKNSNDQFKDLLDAGFSESEIRQYFDEEKNKKPSN